MALAITLGFTLSACEETPIQTDPMDVASINLGVDENYWYDESGPWYDQCVDEIYDYTLRGHAVSFVNAHAAGGTHVVFRENFHYKGIGRDSGIKYVGSGSWKFVLNLPSSGTVTVTDQYWDKAASQGPAGNTREVNWIFHVTVNANGEITAFKQEPAEVRCGGPGN